MREILFRGKSIMRGDWIYGYLNQHRGNIRYDCDCEPIADGCYYINDWQAKIDNGMYGQDYKVDPETVGQFTGLTDRNGVKIFEGDVIEYTDGCNDWLGAVKYDSDDAQFVVRFIGGDVESFDNLYSGDCEVIGNIYDNQELLEVSEND